MKQGKHGGSSNPSPSAIVAFLRGINVGGHKKIPMADLKKAFESVGLRNVRTVLASGNVVFEASGKDPHLDQTISRGLEKAFGFPVKVVLRTVRELRTLVASEPFKGAPTGPNVKLYVTFLARQEEGQFPPSSPVSVRGLLHPPCRAGRDLQRRDPFAGRGNDRAYGFPRKDRRT